MDHAHPICVLKVDCVAHCKPCAVNLKKLLSKIDGIEAIGIDVENGIVTVSGDADPLIILAEIRKKTKKAEILSYVGPKKKNMETKESKKYEKSSKSGKGKEKEEPEHVFEAYVPETTSCKDPFCKAHQSGFSIKTKEPSPLVHYPPPHLGFAPPVALPPYYPPVTSHSYYPPMYLRGSHCPSWPESQQRLEQPFRFDRQLPQPQFDPYMNRRPPRQVTPPYFGQHRAWG